MAEQTIVQTPPVARVPRDGVDVGPDTGAGAEASVGVYAGAGVDAGAGTEVDGPAEGLVAGGSTPAASRRTVAVPYRLISWLSPLLLLVIWEALARSGVISAQVLPAPTKVLSTARELTASGQLPKDALISLRRAATGFVIGGGVGFSLGTAVGFSRLADALLDRPIQMIRAVPFLAILPLVIVWFGIGESGKVFLVALGTATPIYLNTVLGIRQVDPKLLELGRVIGLPRRQLIRRIVLPGALPSILNGIRLALTTAWLALVVAETIGADSGIGFMAMDAREFLRTDVIVLAILIYATIGILSDLAARLLERRLLAWHPNYANART